MFIFSSLFVVWDSTGVAWQDSQFKKKKIPYLSYIDPLWRPSVHPFSKSVLYSDWTNFQKPTKWQLFLL